MRISFKSLIFKVLTTAFVAAGTWRAMAQAPVFRLHPVRDLGKVSVSTVFQDSRGGLWFGANEGLFRFDGQGFQNYELPDTVSNRRVSTIFESGDTIWVGFHSGMIGYVLKNGDFALPFEHFPSGKNPPSPVQIWSPEEGTPQQPIKSFARDRHGGFWFGTYGEGLYCLKNKRLYQFDAADDHLSGDEIYMLALDKKGRVWASSDNGISLCSMLSNGKKIVERISIADGLPDEIIPVLLPDAAGNMWIGTDDRGVCHYNVDNQRFDYLTNDWPHGPVTSLALFEGVEIWIGTQRNGLFRMDLHTGKIQQVFDKNLPAKTGISSLWKDREGLLWVITDKGQIFSANARFSFFETPFPETQAVLSDRQGCLWAGTQTGLFLKENGLFKQVLPEKQNVISLAESPDGNVWAGTFGNGVFILDKNGKVLRHLSERDGLANGSILSMDFCSKNAWLATLGGVTQIALNDSNSADFQQLAHQSELGNSYVYKVLADRRERIWFGTDGKGLSVLENGKFRYFTEADGVPLKTIYSIVEDKNGWIWFSTERQELFSFDGQNFKKYGRFNGLHGDQINALATDAEGKLVVVYNEGLDIYSPNLAHGAFFDPTSGAPAAEYNLNAICTDPQGHVWIGARQGIVRLTSFREPFSIDPETRLRSVSLFLKPIDFHSQTEFSHDNNYFIFDFTGLWFTNPDAVRYRYKLDGFDPDWKTVKDHLASYPNLPPGRYTFRVQSSEHGRFEGTPEASFAFEIARPFWTQWWFFLLVIGAVLALFRWYIRRREEGLHRAAMLKKEKIESQFATLKSQINPHFLFNSFNTLITIIEENPKVAVEYVEHLSDFYRTIMVYREKDLISLQEEMEVVRNFTFLLKKRYESNFNLQTSVNGQPGLIMPLTLQMLVENAVKHNIISKAKPLNVEIFVENEEYIVVRNNIQRKIKPEPSTHFGLQSLINRYQLIGEKKVEVVENESFFMVKVPILPQTKN